MRPVGIAVEGIDVCDQNLEQACHRVVDLQHKEVFEKKTFFLTQAERGCSWMVAWMVEQIEGVAGGWWSRWRGLWVDGDLEVDELKWAVRCVHGDDELCEHLARSVALGTRHRAL